MYERTENFKSISKEEMRKRMNSIINKTRIVRRERREH